MNGHAATAVVILAISFATAALSRADTASTLETDYRSIRLEGSSVATVTFENESGIAATSTTATSEPLEFTPSSANKTDLWKRVEEIKRKAVTDRVYQRRLVEVLVCCYSEPPCTRECVEHFVPSAENHSAPSNETKTLMICTALYDLVGCRNANSDECMAYCRCSNSDPWSDAVGGVMTALFFVCMLLTLVVYACVPRLRNLHGKCLVSYLVALIVGESVATVSNWLVCGQPNSVVSAMVHYLTIVRCCWVNLLCIDVYCTCQPFQSVRQQPRTGCFSRERRKFLYFSAAAWGGSALVFGLLKARQWEYTMAVYSGIILLLLAASCVPLILTLVRISRTRRQTKKNCLNISKMKLNWFYLTSKLLCLSGVGRLVSVFAYYKLKGTPYYKWLFVVLRLEGPIMLFLFVCNVRVRRLVRQRLTTLEWISGDKINDNCSNNK